MLLERDADLAVAEAALDEAFTSATGALVAVEGPPGIGKTQFFNELVLRARGRGFSVLTATGGEFERDLPFGVARQLLGSIARLGRDYVTPPAAAALGLDVDRAVDARAAELNALEGLQFLCVALTAERPLLLAVDDLHWSDSASVKFLLYLARRLADVPVAILVTVRQEGGTARTPEVAQLLDRAEPTLQLSSLSPGTTAQIVEDWFGEPPSELFAGVCATATGGNPLLLRELLGEARAEGIRPRDEDADRLRELGSTNVARSALLRVARLGPAAVDMATSAALLGSRATLPLVAAVAGVEVDEAELVVDGLVEAHLLREGQPLRFVHPIVHSALYRHMAAGLRSRRHREAARLLALSGAGVDEVSQHLLRTAPTRDSWVMEQLKTSGRRALETGAPDVAAIVLRRAAEEDPAAVDAELLLQLGIAEGLVRDPAALEHLEQAFARASEPELLARIALPLARGLAFRTRYADAVRVLDTALERSGDADRETVLKLRAERLWMLESGNLAVSGFVEGAEELAAGLRGETHGERVALGHLGTARLFCGAPRDEVRDIARLALGNGRLLDDEGPESPSWLYSAALLWVVGDYDDAEHEMLRGEQRAHDRGATIALVQIRAARAWVHFELGHLVLAEQLARDVLARTAGRASTGGRYALACLVTVLVQAGRLDEAEEALPAELPRGSRMDRFDTLLLHARGELRLTRGDLGGVDDLLTVGAWCTEHGIENPGEWAWRTDVALALAQRGEPDRARELAEEDVRRATTFGAPRPLGRALNAQAMLATGEERMQLLEQALAVLRTSPARLATAQAELQLGLAQRAAGRISDAQATFRSCLALADECGATGLAAEAHRLLLSVGARPRRSAVSGPGALTPMEREVAALVATGRTNREAAQQLYVSVKAVEKHLRNAYLKLGIERRTELAAALTG